MSSQESDHVSPLTSSPYTHRTLGRSSSINRSRSYLTKDISVDEGDALKKISQAAEEKFESEQKKTAEARMYWHQMRNQEQAKFSDEETDNNGTSERLAVTTSTPLSNRPISPLGRRLLDGDYSPTPSRGSRGGSGSRPSSALGHTDENLSNGGEAIRQWQEKYSDLEGKYKDAMVSSAKLYDEKTTLVYQVEAFKDQLEDGVQEVLEMRAEAGRLQSLVTHAKHKEDAFVAEVKKLKDQIKFRDDFLEDQGIQLPTGDEEEDEKRKIVLPEVFPSEERDSLMKEIAELKEEVARKTVEVPKDSLLRGEETKDIVRESTRLVSEYKTKLQISDADKTRLEGTVTRLKGQVTRYKGQVEDMEKREDELLKEKRAQSREVRRLQSQVDDLESENELLKRRVEQMRKRQKD